MEFKDTKMNYPKLDNIINNEYKEPILHFLMITEYPERWKDLFHSKLIFNKLTDEHILKILFMQKIKKVSSRMTDVVIFLDQIDLDEFNINIKLLNILKYNPDLYGIKIHYIDKDENIPNKYISSIKKLDIELYSKYNDIEK